jgi:hypothetical protein
LVAANALEANSNANPRITLFETVANFMTAPFSSPSFVGERLGRPGSRLARENIWCFVAKIAYNASVGVQQTSRKACRAVHRGSVTWAAKPKVKESLTPQNPTFRKISASFSPLAGYFTTTHMLCRKFPAVRCF